MGGFGPGDSVGPRAEGRVLAARLSRGAGVKSDSGIGRGRGAGKCVRYRRARLTPENAVAVDAQPLCVASALAFGGAAR